MISVNTFLPKEHGGDIVTGIELTRSTEGEKGQQIDNVAGYQRNRNGYAAEGLQGLQATARGICDGSCSHRLKRGARVGFARFFA